MVKSCLKLIHVSQVDSQMIISNHNFQYSLVQRKVTVDDTTVSTLPRQLSVYWLYFVRMKQDVSKDSMPRSPFKSLKVCIFIFYISVLGIYTFYCNTVAWFCGWKLIKLNNDLDGFLINLQTTFINLLLQSVQLKIFFESKINIFSTVHL